MYTGQVDKNVEDEIEFEQLCLAVQFLFFCSRKQDFLSIILRINIIQDVPYLFSLSLIIRKRTPV